MLQRKVQVMPGGESWTVDRQGPSGVGFLFFYSELVMKLQSINTAKLGSPVAIRLDSSKFLVLDDKLLGYNAKDKLSHHEQVRLTSFARSFVSTCVCTD